MNPKLYCLFFLHRDVFLSKTQHKNGFVNKPGILNNDRWGWKKDEMKHDIFPHPLVHRHVNKSTFSEAGKGHHTLVDRLNGIFTNVLESLVNPPMVATKKHIRPQKIITKDCRIAGA